MGSVKVAVRIRPFNGREKKMNSTCCCDMIGPQTIIVNPSNKKDKKFTFDYSYWSHDNYKETDTGELVATSPKYATQQMVFDDLGITVLNNAFDGYNSTLFAYGQTGAGKSFSMVGYGVNKGIVPLVADAMFKRVEANTDTTITYQITVSMLEIYNEAIKCLLNPKINPPGGLKVRQKPGIGVYVDGLTRIPVRSYKEIDARMEEGTSNRTVGATQMNATSSRAHTVATIMFAVITKADGMDSETRATMNLVDLAGSERAESTGATGDRLKEGCAINASLTALGNVIKSLADKANGKKKVFIPYRNSALTRLLQDALGGNSRTIMIAAISPASVNYEETLGTLRYADRAKAIKNKVVKMENPTDKIIRLLREENKKLKSALGGELPEASGGGMSDEQAAEYKKKNDAMLAKQMEENNKILEDMKKSWEAKLSEAKSIGGGNSDTGVVTKAHLNEVNLPFIINLHEDLMMSESLIYMFKPGDNVVGSGRGDVPKPQIRISGLNIKPQHCTVSSADGKVTMTPFENAKCFVNGDLIRAATELKANDRVILGANFVFRFAMEQEEGKHPTWEEAMDEFNEKQGLRVQQGASAETLAAQEKSQRAELEGKLKEMEARLAAEREKARKALDDQRKLMEAGGLSEADRASLLQSEKTLADKEKDMEAELEKRKQMSEEIIAEQMKKKRETAAIEEELTRLMPMVNQANAYAEELEKPVRYEARLSVVQSKKTANLEALKEMKQVEVNIRMVHQVTGAVWTWNSEKFENRYHMMNDMYQNFVNFGTTDVPKAKDAFWDPPQPMVIGKSYAYLKALERLVEIETSFQVLDYKGDERGKLRVEIYPEGPDGEELEYLYTPEEKIVGKAVTFNIRVPFASELPDKFNNNVFVSFDFWGQEYQTDPVQGKNADPKFNYETKVAFPAITEEQKEYLLKEAVIFEVKGYSESAEKEVLEATLAAQDSAGGQDRVCQQCEESPAALVCVDCTQDFCVDCYDLLHKAARKANHKRMPMGKDGNPDVGHLCNQCDETVPTVECKECDKKLCEECNALLHKAKSKKTHTRTPFTAEGGGEVEKKAVCAQCEEDTPTQHCAECDLDFCDGCNNLLHKSAKKKGHVRTPLA